MIRWVLLNYPEGDEFIGDWRNAPYAFAKLFIDGRTVARKRGEGVNEYAIDGKLLKAFGRGVPQSVADLRIPVIISSASILITFVTAWILRERRISWLPNFVVTLGMVGFVGAAHMAYGVLNPTLSSRSLAFEISSYLRPGDQIALYGDIRVAPGIAFYSHREVLLYDATGSNLEFGSQYPDAPKRFFDDKDFSKLWKGYGRVFLVVPVEHKEEVRERLPGNSVWEFAESGGKTVYLNQPLEPGQTSLASLEEGRLTLTAFPVQSPLDKRPIQNPANHRTSSTAVPNR